MSPFSHRALSLWQIMHPGWVAGHGNARTIRAEVPQEGGTHLPCDGLFMLKAVMLTRTGWNSAWATAAPSSIGLDQCLALSLQLRLPDLGLDGEGTMWALGSPGF